MSTGRHGRVAGKVALITGAAGALGAADAKRLAAEGASVVVTDISEAAVKLAAEIGDCATFMRLDVCDEDNWRQVVSDLVSRFGKIDILVNNAGVIGFGDPETITLDVLRTIYAVSVEGTVLGCKHVIPAMRSSGGSIINMSSAAAIAPTVAASAYVAAKGAVGSYTRAVAVHCAQQGYPIRCNSIAPSGIEGPMTMRHLAGDGQNMAAEKAREILQLGTPEDVANAVVYLASEEAAYISGAEIVIDFTSTITRGSVPLRQGVRA